MGRKRTEDPGPERPVKLGLAANAGQFALLVGVNALVGGMIGQERTVLPLLAESEFGLTAFTATLTFILAFGLVKAATNLVAGALMDRFGRRPVLIAGWIAGLGVPVLIIGAPSWSWIVGANVLLGLNQGLAWSATVAMKADLVGPERRGLAMGLNEFAGYTAVSLTAFITGFVAERSGLRPEPFFLGVAYVGLGLGLSVLFVRETRGHALLEAGGGPGQAWARTAALTSFREPTLSACVQAGAVNNLNDAIAWGLFPLLFASEGISVARIGILAGLYPAVWGLGQLATGVLSDRLGRKGFVVAGMWLQAAALVVVATAAGFAAWAGAMVLLGAGTAMVYPTLLAAVGDVSEPRWRASALGVYRSWRDAGFAIGAIAGGLLADAIGARGAIGVVGAMTAASGAIAALRMRESLPRR